MSGLHSWLGGVCFPKMPTLNEYIKAERGNWRAAASMKSKWTNNVAYLVNAYEAHGLSMPGPGPLHARFIWMVGSRAQDADNIAFGAKFIFDGLTKANVIASDNLTVIAKLTHEYHIVPKAMAGVILSLTPTIEVPKT